MAHMPSKTDSSLPTRQGLNGDSLLFSRRKATVPTHMDSVVLQIVSFFETGGSLVVRLGRQRDRARLNLQVSAAQSYSD